MSGKRLYRYDVIRALAIVMVVGVHCIPAKTAPLLGPVSCRSYNEACKTLFFTCNALFFLLSGRFNMRELGEDEYTRYYYRRVRGVLLPTLIYLFIYTVVGPYSTSGSILHIAKVFVLNSLGELSHGIFWFVFSLFGMLLIAPFIASTFVRMGRNGQRWFLGLWFFVATLTYLSKCLEFDYSWSFPLGGFASFFCAGAFIEHSELNDLSTKTLITVGVAAWVSNMLLAYFGWSNGAYDWSPIYALTAVCLYLVLLRVPIPEDGALTRAISFVASQSFGIYLMHWLVFKMISPYFSPLQSMWGPLYHVCLSACVFALGLLLAVASDYLLVKPLQRLMDATAGKLVLGRTEKVG